MPDRKGAVTFKGGPLTLVGNEVKVGDKAPDFALVANDLSPATLATFKGKTLLVTSVPSLDTPVCDRETHRFNEEASKLGDNIRVLTISMDLPFAQKRFCEAEKIGRIRVLSDSVWREFAERYGVLIKDMGLLARSVFVVGKDGRVAYKQIVPELTTHPDYDAALAAAKKAAR
jgi:thioredoxin-dependent peroxiredoxin